jgi:hypothetical protein
MRLIPSDEPASIHLTFCQYKIGSLSSEKTKEIIEGIKLLVDPLPDPRS